MNTWSFSFFKNLDEERIARCFDDKELLEIEKRIKEVEGDIKIIREKLYEQAQKLQDIKIDRFIEVERRKGYSDNRVTIYVRIRTVRTIGKITRNESDYNKIQQFSGLEKKQALAYAAELQKQTGLRIVKENWK